MDDTSKMQAADVDSPRFTPEENLVLAMFLRYLADLESHQPIRIRKNAIKWFTEKEPLNTWRDRIGFSFHDVADILGFSESRLMEINRLVCECRVMVDARVKLPGIRGGSFRARCYSKIQSIYTAH